VLKGHGVEVIAADFVPRASLWRFLRGISRSARGEGARSRRVGRRPIPYVVPYIVRMRKTSVYLDDEQADRLARVARAEGRSQAEIVREAISCYRPRPKRDRNFALAGNFERIDADPRPISEIPEDELMRGFGA
jgi:hypothetical protein